MSLTASKSCIDLYCRKALEPGKGNEVTIRGASYNATEGRARLHLEYNLKNSIATPLGTISGEATFEIRATGDAYVQIDGTGYPSVEVYQYRSGQPTRDLGRDRQNFTYKQNWFRGQLGPLVGLNQVELFDRRIAFYNGSRVSNPNCCSSPDPFSEFPEGAPDPRSFPFGG